MSIINELTKVHNRNGGTSKIVVSTGTRHDYLDGICVEIPAQPLLNRSEKLQDTLLGLVGRDRRFSARLYEPASEAVERDFDGTIFLWNAPGCISSFRRSHPSAQLCLYAQNWLFKTYTRRELAALVQNVDKIICCSQFIANQTQNLLGKESAKIHGLVNGVDTEKFQPSSSKQHEVPVILFVGRVQPFKGPHLIIEAARQIYSPKNPFKIRIVGSSGFAADAPLSDYEIKLRKLAEPLGDVVEFQTFVDRVSILEEYRKASIACIPSIWNEPCSLTVPEAMACGLPTIASSRGGILEVGGDGVLFFDPASVNELAEKLKFLITTPDACSMWGQRGRARAEQISWSSQYDKLRRILGS